MIQTTKAFRNTKNSPYTSTPKGLRRPCPFLARVFFFACHIKIHQTPWIFSLWLHWTVRASSFLQPIFFTLSRYFLRFLPVLLVRTTFPVIAKWSSFSLCITWSKVLFTFWRSSAEVPKFPLPIDSFKTSSLFTQSVHLTWAFSSRTTFKPIPIHFRLFLIVSATLIRTKKWEEHSILTFNTRFFCTARVTFHWNIFCLF